jgi:hypothetical protein
MLNESHLQLKLLSESLKLGAIPHTDTLNKLLASRFLKGRKVIK